MFKVGEEVICINNLTYYGDVINLLELNKKYIVTGLLKDKLNNYSLILEGITRNGFNSNRFVSLLEYRKLKIKKLYSKMNL